MPRPNTCLFSIGFLVAWSLLASATSNSTCRCYPGDACWPSVDTWSNFNNTVGGRLIATIPLAAACHDDQYAAYDATRCLELQDGWLDPETQ